LVSFFQYKGLKGALLLDYYKSITGTIEINAIMVLVFLNSCAKSILQLNKATDIACFVQEEIPKIRRLCNMRKITYQSMQTASKADKEGFEKQMYNSCSLIIEMLKKYKNIPKVNTPHCCRMARDLLELICFDREGLDYKNTDVKMCAILEGTAYITNEKLVIDV